MTTVRVRYTGMGIRRIGPYTWSRDNDNVCRVPVDVAAELLTLPGDDFELDGPPSAAAQKQLDRIWGIEDGNSNE